jgi:hypothetical protein
MEKSSQIARKNVPLRHFFPIKVVPLIEFLLYAELLDSVHDLKSLFRCNSNSVGRLIHECYLVHKELALQP